MLERVAQGQTRFSTPGIAVDGRGIALGRYGLMLFPAIDGVVGWLRLYAADAALDELLAGMMVLRVRTPLASRAFLLQIPAPSSYVLDHAARCARLAGGATYTGSARHFVKYRDERSPYGYDVTDVAEAPAGAELVLHGDDGPQSYARDGELDVRTLVFRMSLRRVPGAERLDGDARADLYLTAPRGLAAGVIRYLWRNRVTTEVALVTPEGGSAFATAGQEGYLVARARDLPARILDGFRGTPGLGVYRPVLDQVVVEVGWEHPVELTSCATLFERDRFYVFSGQRDGVDVIAGPLQLANAKHLMDLRLDLRSPRERAMAAGKVEAVGIELRLAPSLGPPRRVVGTLVGWDEAPRLKQLVYALPPPTLRGHRVAATDRGLVLVAQHNVDVVPLGTLLSELAPGLLVPVGMDLVPRVAPEVLADALGHGAGRLTVFSHDGGPFHVAEDAFVALERRAVARIAVPEAADRPVALALPADDPRVVNDPVGAFALWGVPAPRSTR